VEVGGWRPRSHAAPPSWSSHSRRSSGSSRSCGTSGGATRPTPGCWSARTARSASCSWRSATSDTDIRGSERANAVAGRGDRRAPWREDGATPAAAPGRRVAADARLRRASRRVAVPPTTRLEGV